MDSITIRNFLEHHAHKHLSHNLQYNSLIFLSLLHLLFTQLEITLCSTVIDVLLIKKDRIFKTIKNVTHGDVLH